MTEKRDILFEDKIFTEKFSCNLNECKGICCILPGALGAPVQEDELKVIESVVEKVLNLLDDNKRNVIQKNGFYENTGGRLYINTYNRNDCVFSFYDDGIALCAFQKLYNEKIIDFKKPISCDLFPIRISKSNRLFGKEKWFMRYEQYSICRSAVTKGKEDNVTVFEFCTDALKRIMSDEEIESFKTNK